MEKLYARYAFSVGESVKLVLIFLGFQIVGGFFAAPLLLLDQYLTTSQLLGYAMAIASLAAWILMIRYLKKHAVFGDMPYAVPSLPAPVLAVLFFMYPFLLFVETALVELLQMPDLLGGSTAFDNPGPGLFFAVVLIAPLFEEIFFRGVLLRGLLMRYDPLKAILVSAFLFGFIHLNPAQLIGASAFGLFAGIIYYQTRSLFYPILFHFLNNGLAFLLIVVGGEAWEEASLRSLIQQDAIFFGLLFVAAVVVYLTLRYIFEWDNPHRPVSQVADEEE